MQDIAVIIILITLAFVGVALIGRKSSQKRTKILEEIDDIEELDPSSNPKEKEENQFSSLLSKELTQQQRDNEHFEIDADPQITLSDKVASSIQAEKSQINITIDDDIDESDLLILTPLELDKPEESVLEQESIEQEFIDKTEEVSIPVKENTVDTEWEMVIAFTVMSREGTFSGRSIKTTLESLDLHFGDMQIYHRTLPGLNKHTLFSVANILAPGTLNPDDFVTMETPGLLIFSHLPGPINGLAVFDELLDAARKMTDKLDGILSDESRQAVSQTSIEAMRSKILEFNLRMQVEESNINNDY